MRTANVCDIVVGNDLCVGCGVCAGISNMHCNLLQIGWNKYGEYIPIKASDKCNNCSLCLQVCPFWNENDNETVISKAQFKDYSNIHYNKIIGYYLDLFSGYSCVNNQRENGASGGLTTWLLEAMLTSKFVDCVICVKAHGDADCLFRYSIIDSVREIRDASKSVYYPVEMSEVISEIANKDKRYALVGLPCVLKGMRLAARKYDQIAARIVVMVGLVCGQAKGKYFAEYLTAKAGGEPAKLRGAIFRVKDLNRHHLDHRFQFTTGSNEDGKVGYIYQSEGMSGVWGQDWFKLNACNYCDDITAEVADITFGDAIEKEYSYGNMGANFAIVRSPIVRDLLLRGAKTGEIVIDRVPEQAIISRQKGLVLNKRDDLAHRLYMRKRKNDMTYVPVKRVVPKRRFAILENSDMEAREASMATSKITYSKYRYMDDVVEQVDGAVRASRDKALCNTIAGRLLRRVTILFTLLRTRFAYSTF